MPPAVTRELSIQYAGVTLGGTSAINLLHHPYRLRREFGRVRFEGRVTVVDNSSEANAWAAWTAMEAAFSKPNQDLVITQGGQSTTYSHANNTGFLGRPECRKLGDKDTGRSRTYEVSLECKVPNPIASKNGLMEATSVISTSPSGRRSYQLTGTFTASGSNGALAQYTANIAALLTALEQEIDPAATWERDIAPKREDREDENKILKFSRTGQEVIYADSQGALNNASIKNQKLAITRTRIAPGDVSGAERPVEIAVLYDADIDKSLTQDLAGFYTSTIQPYLIQVGLAAAGGSSGALVKDSPGLDYPNNRISATIEMLVVTGSSILSRTLRTRDTDQLGKVLLPVHDGNPYAKEKFQGPASRTRLIVDTKITLGGGSGAAGGGLGSRGIGVGDLQSGFIDQVNEILGRGEPDSGVVNTASGTVFSQDVIDSSIANKGGAAQDGGSGEPAGYELMYTILESAPQVKGLPELQCNVTEITQIHFLEYAEPPSGGTGGGGDAGQGDTSLRGEIGQGSSGGIPPPAYNAAGD